MNYIAITLSLINVCLLFVFLFKFKSLFTTDDIVEKTKQKINQIVGDVNQNAQRDIDLINHCQRQMRTLLKESEEKMQEFQQATNLLRDMLAEIDRQGVNKNIQYTQKTNTIYNNSLTNQYTNVKSNVQNDFFSKSSDVYTTKNDVYTRPLHKPNIKSVENRNEQPDLFSQQIDQKPNKKVSNLNQKVEMLYNQGYTVEQIASELSCSVTEVQLIIDMI